MITVVTTCSAQGAVDYGHACIADLVRHWPHEIGIVYYAEGPRYLGSNGRVSVLPIEAIGTRQVFLQRYSGSEAANGRVPMPSWRSKDVERGQSFRTDAIKFCHKVFVMRDAAAWLPSDSTMIWMDADVRTLRDVRLKEIEAIIGGADVAYLGRKNAHSECGFMSFSLPTAKPFLDEMAALYLTGEVFKLPEWHDSYVFDVMRARFPGLSYKNLTNPQHPDGHVWVHSPLGGFSDHLKGARKKLGSSPEMMERNR